MLRLATHTAKVLAFTRLKWSLAVPVTHLLSTAKKSSPASLTCSADGHMLTAWTQLEPDFLVMNMGCIFFIYLYV